jgi:hypothetical protein
MLNNADEVKNIIFGIWFYRFLFIT